MEEHFLDCGIRCEGKMQGERERCEADGPRFFPVEELTSQSIPQVRILSRGHIRNSDFILVLRFACLRLRCLCDCFDS